MITKEQLAQLIDYTLLKPDTTEDSIKHLCEEAIKYKFHSVCVNPTYVSLASSILNGTEVKVCSVVGFPLGASTSKVKTLETERAIRNGASEIDMVINIGALKSHDYELAKKDLFNVVERARTCKKDIIVKVIIETGLLTKKEKQVACELIKESGANFVKTSTGFNALGATVYDVKFLKKNVGPNIKVKASGGIRTFHEVTKLVKAGADRIGTSSGVVIMDQYSNESNGNNVNLEKKKASYLYFLCLINWHKILESEELNQIKNYIKEIGELHELIGDWIKVNLGWEKDINMISKSELGFYHSRLIFKFRLREPPKDIAEIREIREEIEEKIKIFCEDEKKGIIKQIKQIAKPPYLFTYPIFELGKGAEFWRSPQQRPYSLQTTCFYTKLDDRKRSFFFKGKKVQMRISGAQIIATRMSRWFFETLVNIVFHEGLYRQTRDDKLKERHKNTLIYRNLENRLEDFASSLMTMFHQYSSDYHRRRIQRIALRASIIIPMIGFILGFLYFIFK